MVDWFPRSDVLRRNFRRLGSPGTESLPSLQRCAGRTQQRLLLTVGLFRRNIHASFRHFLPKQPNLRDVGIAVGWVLPARNCRLPSNECRENPTPALNQILAQGRGATNPTGSRYLPVGWATLHHQKAAQGKGEGGEEDVMHRIQLNYFVLRIA